MFAILIFCWSSHANAQKQNGCHEVVVLLVGDFVALISWQVWLILGNFGAKQLFKHSVDQGYNSTQAMNASAGTILELTKMECQQCKDVPRLCAAVSLLCQLISCAKPVSSSALQSLLALMVNRYPKVRCCIVFCAAQQAQLT